MVVTQNSKWGQGSLKEARKWGKITTAFDPNKKYYETVPDFSTWEVDKDASYFHFTQNETIGGIEYIDFPFDKVDMPVVCDMSSDIGCVVQDFSKFGVVYAGAQKNLGPAGVTVVIIRKDLIDAKMEDPHTPDFLSYSVNAKSPGQLFNTCSTFSIFMLGLNVRFLNQKGLQYYEDLALKRSGYIYDVIDSSGGFYKNVVDPKLRSRTNLTFTTGYGDPKVDDLFVSEARKRGMLELKGHRSLGGIRASCYNGMPMEGAVALGDFMKEFQQTHGTRAKL